MADESTTQPQSEQLEGGTYEIIRKRLDNFASDLRQRLEKLNQDRKAVFGSIETRLLATERVTTEHSCLAQDMVALGQTFLFGYNVKFGLKKELHLTDVFSVYAFKDRQFHQLGHELLTDPRFEEDLANLYRYYKETRFVRFAIIGTSLFMVFQVGASPRDIKTFKWAIVDAENDQPARLNYLDNRSDHELAMPNQHEFAWTKTTRDDHRPGKHPHVSIRDRLFVETVGGDLTIKIENNTDTGAGVYAEPVENPDQTLDDGEIHFAFIGNLIALKIKPYQERKYRYIVYNTKTQQAHRVDSLEESAVLLPDDHGLIFANGYFLQNGDFKMFETNAQGMMFERRIVSPNGEDFLFAYYNPASHHFILLQYNLIEQAVQNPTLCNGYTLFDDGQLCYFRASESPQRHHAVQIWQTPFVGPDFAIPSEKKDSYLFKIGNKDIVEGMAEANEVLNLLTREQIYQELYLDLVKKATDIIDTYHWLGHDEAARVREPIVGIREAATSAIEEFEKVTRIRQNTTVRVKAATEQAQQLMRLLERSNFQDIDQFVKHLALLRQARGEVISLRELRYVDLPLVERFDDELAAAQEKLSQLCVGFLLRDDALRPYHEKVAEIRQLVERLEKVIDADRVEKRVAEVSKELEMLIEIVTNLKIEDATQTTRIIDGISAIYSDFNQINAAVKRRRRELAAVEGKAEFNAQIKLVGQSLLNFLDVADTPEKCDENLTKLMVQLEEMEGKFSEFDEFVGLIGEKREEVYNAFEAKKVGLVEARNKRATTLMQAGERILKAIESRVRRMENVAEINAYYASDMMIEKIRDLAEKLLEIGDSVKADDLHARLKTVREDAVRQLKDKSELFVEGKDLIKMGEHRFSVNTQNLGLTLVQREGKMFFHITGTAFFEELRDEAFNSFRDLWEQALPSENEQVYRSEFLAHHLYRQSLELLETPLARRAPASPAALDHRQLMALAPDALLAYVRAHMETRFDEGYLKGVHDPDAARILGQLLAMDAKADLLRFSPAARAMAELFWNAHLAPEQKAVLDRQVKGLGLVRAVFPESSEHRRMVEQLARELELFAQQWGLFDPTLAPQAADYLFHEASRGDHFIIDAQAARLATAFHAHLLQGMQSRNFRNSLDSLAERPAPRFALARQWASAYIGQHGQPKDERYLDELAATLFFDNLSAKRKIDAELVVQLQGLNGSHPRIDNGAYALDYEEFFVRLGQFARHVAPRFARFVQLKKDTAQRFEQELRLSEFKPKVLSSFVRNQLIDKVYFPLIGNNLAKQIGTAGENTRTDRMGMLLLVSPPGYGKTTLMEYVANRLGIIFMKINGPAIGHNVTSVDPAEASNAAAAEELKKLNLSFEMGDNIMIYLDDIQHCNPEFLQKFITLADGQRKIEGVYKGRTKTYDFRGKKVCVVMAGNPYTESGDKFQIPDMLSNRADIYNLGDIVGDTLEDFLQSYVENSLTSNAILAKLAAKSHKDVLALLKVIRTKSREGLEFEANHSPEEINEYLNVLEKIVFARDIVSQVNQQYILSAAQQDAYRTEPPFKLQGSYRDMNKIVEKIVPIMNPQELQALVMTHYTNEAQTLTTGAEANLLKFKAMQGWATPAEQQRWADILEIFRKQQKAKGYGQENAAGAAVAQMERIAEQLAALTQVFVSHEPPSPK